MPNGSLVNKCGSSSEDFQPIPTEQVGAEAGEQKDNLVSFLFHFFTWLVRAE